MKFTMRRKVASEGKPRGNSRNIFKDNIAGKICEPKDVQDKQPLKQQGKSSKYPEMNQRQTNNQKREGSKMVARRAGEKVIMQKGLKIAKDAVFPKS